MAYGKNYKKRPYTKNYVKVSKHVKRYIAKKLDQHIENKIRTAQLDDTWSSVGTAWTELALSNVTQGTGASGRIGNKIRIKSLEIKGIVAQGSNELVTDDAYNVLRVVIGTYNNNNITPLATAGQGINDIVRVGYNSARGSLRQKFLDKYIPLNVQSTEQGAGDGYTPQVKLFNYYKKFNNLVIQFNDDSTTYPNQVLVMSVISDSVAITNPGFINGWWCLTYEDA